MLLLHQKLRIGAENGKWLELINITKYTLSILAPFPRSSRWVRVHNCTITINMVLTRSNISEVMTENVSTSNFKWNHIVPRWNYVVPNWNYIGPTWNYMVPPRKKKLGFFNFWGWKKLLAYFCDDECEIGFLKILF